MKLLPASAVLIAIAALGCGSGQSTSRSEIETEAGPLAGASGPGPAAETPGTAPAASPGAPPAGSPPAAVPATNSAAPPAGSNEPTPPPVVADNGVELRFAFSANDTYKFSSRTETQSSGNGPDGKPVSSKFATSQNLNVKVLSVKDGKAELETKADAFKVEGDAKDQQAQMIKGMMAQQKEVVTKAVYDSLGKPAGENPDLSDPMRSMVNGVGAAIGVFGINYPGKAVKIGDSWSSEFDLGKLLQARIPPGVNTSVQNGKVPTTYTLKSVDPGKGVAVIEVSMKASPKMQIVFPEQKGADGKTVKMPPMNMALEISSKGSVTVDLKTGLPISMTTESTSATTGTQMMDGKQTSKTTLKRV